MCDPICDVISYCDWSWNAGKINVYDIMIENQKKIKYGNRGHFYINLDLINGLGMEYTAF